MTAGARPWKEGKKAGKPRRGRGKVAVIFTKVRPIVAAAVLLAGLVVGFSPDLRGRTTGKIGDVKDSVMSRLNPTYVPLSPISISGTTFDVEHPATNVVDSNTLTAWVALASDGEPALTARFDEPFDLERITVWNGTSEGFKDRERAHTIHLVFDTGTTFDLVLDDLPEPKDYAIDGGEGILEVELFVTSTYSSLNSDELALSEIEFLFRR